MTGLRSGVVLQGVDPPEVFEGMVREIEDLGFDELWLTDSSLHARNPYIYLALASRASSRLRLGTAVTNPVTRHPAVTAVAIATLDEISAGRAVLGIGAGDRPLKALGVKPASVDTLCGSVEMIRHLLAGERVTERAGPYRLHDAHFRVRSRPDIPVFISASGERTLEMAGRVADGVILLVGLFREAVEWAGSCIQRGADSAGRPRPHMAVFAYGAISNDEEQAMEAARSIAAWFPQTAPRICELAGLDPGLVEAVRQRYAGGEFQEAAEAARLLPDDFVRQVALAGSREVAAERIRTVLDAGADSVHVFPLGPERMDTVRAFARCWADVSRERAVPERPVEEVS